MDSNAKNILPLRGERRLTVFMFTDIVDYSRITNANELESLKNLTEHNTIIRDALKQHGGRELRNIGDAFFLEFDSTIEAVNCAYNIQSALHTWNLSLPETSRFAIRIGVHVGEVIHTGNDAFGDDVNISARIEKFSEPGGIAITQQAFDQVDGRISFDFRFSTRQKLKGIPRPVAIYKAKLPWLGKKSAAKPFSLDLLRRTLQQRHWVNWTLCLAMSTLVLGTALSFLLNAHTGFQQSLTNRSPFSAPTLDLASGWSINLNPEETPGAFIPFSADNAKSYADRIHGPYELRKNFSPVSGLTAPAIVLGIIPDQHQAFVNGRYIGGSKTASGVTYYTFDPSLLKTEESNQLLIKAFTTGTLSPGISIIPGIGAFLGEVGQVHSKVTRDRISFLLPRIIYLAVSLVAFLACVAGFVFNTRNKKYLYYGLYLCAGCTMLAYYMPGFVGFLDVSQYTRLKLYPLALSSFILISSYLSLQGKLLWENLNNVLALVFFVAMATCLPEMGRQPSLIGLISDRFYVISLIYTAIATVGVLRLPNKSLQGRIAAWMIGTFGAINFVFCYLSLKGDWVPRIPGAVRGLLQQVAASYPLLFSLTLLIVGLLDYSIKVRALQKSQGTRELIQKISKTISTIQGLSEAVEQIQRGLCQILQVERSTLYLFDRHVNSHAHSQVLGEGAERLVAQSVLHPQKIQNSVKRFVELCGQGPEGIIGHVLQTKAPILIQDVRTDERFRARLEPNTYKTHSCMIFPLILGGDLLGVVTFADKKDETVFTSEDFQAVQMLTGELSLLMSHFRIQDLLQSYLKTAKSTANLTAKPRAA